MAKPDEGIHAGHRERMRERFEENKLSGFHDHEVLEMLLFYAVRRGDTNALAHQLLKEFDTLHGILTADRSSLCNVKGVGDSIATFLIFIGEFHDYVEHSRIRGVQMDSPENRCLYFHTKLSSCMDENLLAACLNDDLKVIRCFTVAKGAPGHVSAEMQTLARLVLSVHCSRVMIAHNHPNGKALPSMEDITSTNNIAKVLNSIGIELIDHIIIGNNGSYSMLQKGVYIPEPL